MQEGFELWSDEEELERLVDQMMERMFNRDLIKACVVEAEGAVRKALEEGNAEGSWMDVEGQLLVMFESVLEQLREEWEG